MILGVSALWPIPSNVDKVTAVPGHEIDFSTAAARKKYLDQVIDSGDQEMPPREKRTSGVSKFVASLQPPTAEEVKKVFAALHASGARSILLSAVPEYADHYVDPVKPAPPLPGSLRKLRTSKCDQMNSEELKEYCISQQDKVRVSHCESDQIELLTRKQHKSPAWYSYRTGRVTASKMHDVMNFNLQKPAISTIKAVCHPPRSLTKVPAVQWGLEHETVARQKYFKKSRVEHRCFKLENSGFVINPLFPYIGASPDGLSSCECCGKGCIEVKCPYKHRSSLIADACEDPGFCLSHEQGKFTLKKSHPYYSQVQTQMLVTGLHFCDFVVWTTIDCVVVRVEEDKVAFPEYVRKAESFFHMVVLPELCAQSFTAPNRPKPVHEPVSGTTLPSSVV